MVRLRFAVFCSGADGSCARLRFRAAIKSMTGDGVDIVAHPTDLDQLWYKPSSTRLLRAGFVIFVQKSLFRAKPLGGDECFAESQTRAQIVVEFEHTLTITGSAVRVCDVAHTFEK